MNVRPATPGLLAGALAALAACQPIHTDHTYDHAYPAARRDLLLRWIGTPSGPALWISTADDGERNGRYEGFQVLVDPGGPTDVEEVVLPALARNGLNAGMPLAYVVLTGADPAAIAGAERLAREFRGVQVVTPGRPPLSAKGRPDTGPATLKIGPELSARLLRPAGMPVDAQALALRFIDVQLLVLPHHAEGLSGAFAASLGPRFEKEGLRTTFVSAGDGGIDAEALAHLEPEVVVGDAAPAGALRFSAPAPGSVLELGTNGSEVRAPGPRTRSRYGHWLGCDGRAPDRCGADFAQPGGGPVFLRITLPSQDEGLFLVDTRAPLSYLVRSRFERIPGWESASGGGHSHGGGAIGLEVPPFALEGGGRSVSVHRWRVLPIEPFRVGGEEVAGVVGMDLLQSFRLELRPRERVVSLTPNFDVPRERLAPAERSTRDGISIWDVPMDRSPAGPLILATLDGEPKSLIVDLAAEQTRVYVRETDWPRVAEPRPHVVRAFDVPDELDDAAWKEYPLTAGALTVKVLNLSGATFTDRPALAIDRPLQEDVLGLDFLRTFDRVSLDFRRRSILLEKNEG